MSGSGVSAGPRSDQRPGVIPSRWSMGRLEFGTLVLCVLGLADSAYQTYTHYSGTGLLGCSFNGDPCQVVQHSSQAYVFGIPVAVFGVAFYAFMVAICSPWAWRATAPGIGRIRLTAAVAGMG
ncbi:MAG: vitamin K epoxide reductase family protein, partial [Streptosporangiaceae bacterium]